MAWGNSERDLSAVLAAAAGLRAESDGLWSAPAEAPTAFPPHAHDACLQLEHGSFWFEHRNRCIVELVARHPPRGAIVDVGGGNGYVAHGLRAAGFAAIVLEPGAAGARNALQRGLAPVIKATLEAACFREASLPAMGLFDVLEHIADVRAFLVRAVALLQPGGRLYATVPAYMKLWSGEDVAAGHVRRYTRTGLCRQLHESGLTVDFASYFFSPLPAPILLLRALPERLGIARASNADECDHTRRAPLLRPLLDAALSLELRIIRRGHRLPMGASILVAAHKEGCLS